MNVNFYTFTKRINSTAQPSGGTSYSCILKEPTSVAAPEIALIWNGSSNPTAYNYAYIADFRRYYWVNNWTYKDRQWVARLAVDPLASFKSEIGASAKYVLRAASDYDPEAIDTLYPATADYAAEGTISGTDLGWDVYGSGGGAALIGASFLHYTIYSHVSTDPTENGRPLAAHRMLNTLSGFIQCRDGDIPAPATSEELSAINSYLTGGFFYE